MDTTPRLNDSDNTLLKKICLLLDGAIPSGVISFNARTGAVTLSSADVTGALGYTPVNKAGDTMSGTLELDGTVAAKFSGTTSAFPALKRSSTTLQVRLADDSNWAPLTAGLLTSQTGGMAMITDDSATTFAYQCLFKKRGTTGDATAAVTNASELGTLSFQAWNGVAYITCAQIVGRAAQNQGIGANGGQISFNTTPNGTSSAAVRVIISQQGNILVSNVNTIEPASLVGGTVFKDGIAASADPTTASAMWSVGGALQYRTSGTNDGSGRTHNLHNRAAQQAGVGTNYSVTNSTAQANFGTTNAAVTLPTVGTYLVQANVSIINGATADDIYNAKLRDTTNAADLTVNKKVSGGPASGRANIFLSQIVVTTVANTAVQIFAFNETGARGTIESTTTDMSYVRLS